MADKKIELDARTIIMMVLVILIVPMLPLLISWHWNWWEAWVYAFVSIFGFVVSRYLAGKKNPGLLAERGKHMRHDDAEEWDKKLSPLTGLGGSMILIVAGLDALFEWTSEFGLLVRLFGLVLLLVGYYIGSYALYENAFFSGMVRLQTDRGHHVIDSGPYTWVRHPGYMGALLTYLGTPLLLDSWWAFIPVVFMFVVLIYRTSKEDQFLQENLEGYKAFTGKTQYRLFPGIW